MRKFLLMFLLINSLSLFAEIEDPAETFYNDANKLFKEKKYDEAVTEFENAVNLDKDYFFIMSNNGIFEVLLNNSSQHISEQVRNMCNNILEENEKVDFFVYYYLGWALLNLGLKEDAIKNIDIAVKKMEAEEVDADIAKALLKKAQGNEG